MMIPMMIDIGRNSIMFTWDKPPLSVLIKIVSLFKYEIIYFNIIIITYFITNLHIDQTKYKKYKTIIIITI